mgnify:FL=1
MLTIKTLREYLNLPPDAEDTVAELCLEAAKSKARAAGIPDYKNNATYDLFLCALAGCWYDNRGLCFITGNSALADESAQRMINTFVLELRHAGEDSKGALEET